MLCASSDVAFFRILNLTLVSPTFLVAAVRRILLNFPLSGDIITLKGGVKMNFDLTVTVSVIIALCAIISPILVAIINNHYQLKLKQIEIAREHKMQTFEEYLSALQRRISNRNSNIVSEYAKAFGNALIYASPSTQSVMFEINEIINSTSYDKFTVDIGDDLIKKVCKKLQEDMNV